MQIGIGINLSTFGAVDENQRSVTSILLSSGQFITVNLGGNTDSFRPMYFLGYWNFFIGQILYVKFYRLNITFNLKRASLDPLNRCLFILKKTII